MSGRAVKYVVPGPEDEEKVYALLNLLYEGHVDGGLKDVMKEFLADGNFFKLAAADAETGKFAAFMLGSCRLEVDFECRAAIIEEIVVLPEYRKLGLGRALLESFEAWSRERGAKGFLVPCGREGFYEAMGFEKFMVRRYWKEFK